MADIHTVAAPHLRWSSC